VSLIIIKDQCMCRHPDVSVSRICYRTSAVPVPTFVRWSLNTWACYDFVYPSTTLKNQ